MTFCVGIQVREGLIALGDTQIVRGSEQHNKGKLAVLQHENESFFLMTSGLRSVRDKAVIYLEQAIQSSPNTIDRLYQIANLFGEQLRRVKQEDGPSLAQANYSFNLHAVIGGKLAGDMEPTLFYVYPEGNWIESSIDSPYFVIGRTPYAKPILDRLLSFESTLSQACALSVLAFDMTRTSVTDVDFPIDLIAFHSGANTVSQHRFQEQEMQEATQWWEQKLAETLREFPMDWSSPLSLHSPASPNVAPGSPNVSSASPHVLPASSHVPETPTMQNNKLSPKENFAANSSVQSQSNQSQRPGDTQGNQS